MTNIEVTNVKVTHVKMTNVKVTNKFQMTKDKVTYYIYQSDKRKNGKRSNYSNDKHVSQTLNI